MREFFNFLFYFDSEKKKLIYISPLLFVSLSGVLTGRGANVNTVVKMLIKYRAKWPTWIKFVATSRPDEATREQLRPLSGARIDVKDEHNLEDILRFVSSKVGKGKEDVVETICTKAAGVFMFASEVCRQYEEDPELKLDGLPAGLAELYMDR